MKPVSQYNLLFIFLISVLALGRPVPATAFPIETYAANSVLAQGKWVKISVSETGVYLLSTADLRRWGFNDPSRVRVYGYGGQRISDNLTAANYIDDLPQVQTATTARGIVFYGVGPETWAVDSRSGRHTRTTNPFSTKGYYYLTDSDTAPREIPAESGTPASTPATTVTAAVIHEQDLISPNRSGHYAVGEDFRFNQSRDFRFNLPGRVEDTDVWMQCGFLANTPSATSRLTFSANGSTLPSSSSDNIRPNSSSDACGDTCVTSKTFSINGSTLNLNLRYSVSGVVKDAYLDYIVVNYTRNLDMDAALAGFFTTDRCFTIAGASAQTTVWDVTDPLNLNTIETAATQNGATASTPRTGLRRYIAWNDNSAFRTPVNEGTVRNQDIHSVPVPDMVIVTTSALRSEAERIARLHRDSRDSLDVYVVEQSLVYNEFGSGCGDVNAIRRMLKMFYDRGNADGGKRLKYLLMMGRGTFDHRRVTTQGQNQHYEPLPIWQTNTGHNVSTSYCSDDILAMMADGSGLNFGGDKLDIAVGRISARTADEARVFVDRLIKYCNTPVAGEWRNHVMLLADDQDSGTHMKQTETMVNNMQSYESGLGMMYTKVYIDEFEFSNSMYAGARDKMYRTLDNGVAWWNYIGHGGSTTLTADKQFETSDLYSLYLRHAPVFYAATCTFGRWDDVEQCGIEALTLEESGGAVAAISATRPVYISLNGVLSASLGLEAFARDENGRFRTVGEIINRAKNAMTNDDLNKRRYVLLGDPAMRLMVPENHAVLESIDGVEVTDENQVTVSALQRPVFRGSIYDTRGEKMTSFNGTVSLTLYDAEYSSTTRGRSTEKDPGEKVTFEQQGNRLYSGSGAVIAGEFAVTIPMPAEVSDNFRPAALNMYARAESGEEASGMNRDFYVYGFDDTAQADTVPPTIDRIYINHESFRSGDAVNTTPTLIVTVSDDVGINLSNSGVGHQMAVSVDGKLSYNNVAAYYTPAEDGSAGGSVIFPLGTLSNGHHELTFKVWDTSSNSSAAVIEFNVVEGQAPKIFDAYSDANPASVEANFYVSHNRPDAMLTVTVDILDLDGRLLWSDSNKGRADMFLTSPIHWNLCNSAGHRVPRGIYIYRVTVSTGSGETSSVSKRIAVTGQ